MVMKGIMVPGVMMVMNSSMYNNDGNVSSDEQNGDWDMH